MSVIPERPASADSAERAHRAYLKEIDYHSSIMNGEVLRRQATIEMKKANTLKKMRVAAPDGSIAGPPPAHEKVVAHQLGDSCINVLLA